MLLKAVQVQDLHVDRWHREILEVDHHMACQDLHHCSQIHHHYQQYPLRCSLLLNQDDYP